MTNWLINDNNNVKYRTVEEVWDLKNRRNAYRLRYNEYWLATSTPESPRVIDAILCPTGPGPAPPHGQAKYWSYTSQFNLLEYPGAVFPATFVSAKNEGDKKDVNYVPTNEKDKFNYDLYPGPEFYEGVPIGLQIVTRRFEDEKCLAVLGEVERAMGRK